VILQGGTFRERSFWLRLVRVGPIRNKKGVTEPAPFLGATRLRLHLQACACPKKRLTNQTSIFFDPSRNRDFSTTGISWPNQDFEV